MKKEWKKIRKIVISVTLMTIMIFTGCGKSIKTKTSDGTSDFKGDFIISAQEAVEKMDDESVLFIDARDKVKRTMKGAVHISWPSITIQDGAAGDATWCTLPEPEELEQLLQEKGIEKDREIVVLGLPEGGWGEDGRVLWELREAGCTNLKFVDGGISAMKDVGVEFKSSMKTPEKTDMKITELDKSHEITTEELQANYDNYKIVDVRLPKEYDGAVLYEEAQGGHMPGAVNIPYVDMFQKDGTLKSNEEIVKMFETQGIQKDDKVVTYCTGGIRAAYTQLVLEMCGYENTYNYLQSFWRWAAVGEVEK